MTAHREPSCTMWGHVAACWLRLGVEKGGCFWITKTTSCPSLILSPGSCPSLFLLRSPPRHEAQVFVANVCKDKKSHFPGTFGPGSFSGVRVWSWLWLSVKPIVCMRTPGSILVISYFSLCCGGHNITSNITYTRPWQIFWAYLN